MRYLSQSEQGGGGPTASVGATWLTRGMTSSARLDWETPNQLFYFLEREFRFDLDACAVKETAKCPVFLDAATVDAMHERWHERGSVIWVNPPYGRKVGAWIRKGYEESQHGATVVMLLPARTDTSWWHDYCMKGEIRFLRGRLRFDSGRGRAPFPSAIVIFRGNQ